MPIINLLHYFHAYNPVMGRIMQPDQATQIAREALQAPLNNVVALLALIALIIIGGGGYGIFRLFKYLANENSPLVKVLREIRDAFTTLKTSQADKTTQVITATNLTNELLREQTAHIDAHETTTRETVTTLSGKVEGLGAEVKGVRSDVNGLKANIELLNQQIEALLNNKADCMGFKQELTAFEERLLEKIKKDTRETNTVNLPPTNVTHDNGAAGQENIGKVA